MLQKLEEFFDVTIVTWKTDIVYLELKYNANPICQILCPVPKLHKDIFKKEVEHLVLLGSFESRMNQSGEPRISNNLNLKRTK